MRKEEIDEIFKEGVHSEFPYDENIWNQIVDQLPTEKERKFGWVWYLNGFIVLFIHFLTFGITDAPILQPETAELYDSKTQLITKKPTEENIESPEEASSNTATKQSIKNRAAIEPNNSSEVISTELADEQSTNTSDKKKSGASKQLNENNWADRSVNSQINPKVEQANKESDLAILSTVNSLEGEPPLNTRSSVINDELDLDLVPMPLLSANLFSKHDLAEPSFSTFNPKGIPQQKPIYVEFQYKYGITATKELTGLEGQLKEIKTKAEKTHSMEQLGVLFLKDLGKFRVGIGARYFKLVERINYNIEQESETATTTYDTTYTLVNANFNQNGIPVWLIRENITSLTSIDRSNSKLSYQYENRLEYLQIPLTLGYNQYWNRYLIGLRAGLIGQYLLNAEGGYLHQDETKVISFDEADNLNEINLSSEAALRFGYGINEFIWIGTEYNYQYGVTSLTKDYDTKLRGSYIGVWLQLKAF